MYKWSKVHELLACLTARKMQIKTTERGRLLKWLSSKRQKMTSARGDMRKGNTCCRWELKLVWKTVWQFPRNLKSEHPSYPAIYGCLDGDPTTVLLPEVPLLRAPQIINSWV